MDLSPGWILIPSPCGCVIEATTLHIWYTSDINDIMECPWCQATFEAGDLDAWLDGDVPRPIFLERPPLRMIKCEGKALEIVNQLRCGCPLVREPGGHAYHLDSDIFEMLEN